MKKFFDSKKQSNKNIRKTVNFTSKSRTPKSFLQDISKLYQIQKGIDGDSTNSNPTILSQDPQRKIMKKLPKANSALLHASPNQKSISVASSLSVPNLSLPSNSLLLNQESIVCNSCKNILVPFQDINGTKNCFWNNEYNSGWLIISPSPTIPLQSKTQDSRWIPENGVVFQPMVCGCNHSIEVALKIIATNKENTALEGSIIILNKCATKCFAAPRLQKRKYLENSYAQLTKKIKLENT